MFGLISEEKYIRLLVKNAELIDKIQDLNERLEKSEANLKVALDMLSKQQEIVEKLLNGNK